MDDKRAIGRMRAMLCELEAEERGMSLDEVKRLRGVKLSGWLWGAIGAVISGYHDRERCLRDERVLDEVGAEYARINRAVDDAIATSCFGYGEQVVNSLREDMIAGRGWRMSGMSAIISERTFYKIKKQCFLYVAARLYWV